jgi:hypothetical protein
MAAPSPQEDAAVGMPPPPPARAPVALATMALVLAAAALAGILYGVIVNQQLEARLKTLEATQAEGERTLRGLGRRVEALDKVATLLSGLQADLTSPALQPLSGGFAVTELKLARKDSGVVVAGRMVNTSSLRYRDVTFRIKVGNTSKEFEIGRLAPGGSDQFQAELANLPLENARLGTFSLVSSAVEYDR